MRKIRAFLLQPAPTARNPWVITLAVTAVVFFMLLLLIQVEDTILRWKILIGFSLITAGTTLMWGYFFPKFFRKFYAINTWTIWKMLVNNIIIIIMISIGNTILDYFLFDREPGMLPALSASYILITLLIGLLPTTIASLIVWNHQLRYNLLHSSEINTRLSTDTYPQNRNRTTPVSLSETIILRGSTKETVELVPDKLLYIETSGNYLLINYLTDDGNMKQKQIRNTIAQIQKTLEVYPEIVRCHRGFMVNLSYVICAEGNAQGLRLKLSSVNHYIPVSRNFLSVVRKGLA